ncbi:MAG: relaxase MobL [Clostridiales bacterium]|nr:relaxase MobL [Clostridiales bacterium]
MHRTVIDNSRFDAVSSYISYMGTREGTQIFSHGHGLFGFEDDINIGRVQKDTAGYRGPVFSHVISLKTEDAQRLGYNRAEEWKRLLRSHIFDIGEMYGIKATNLHWYAAYHDNAEYPHIHLILYGTEENKGKMRYENGLKLAAIINRDIFRMSPYMMYRDNSKLRQNLADVFHKRVNETDTDTIVFSAELKEMMKNVNIKLHEVQGNKQYHQLKKDIKEDIDRIICSLADSGELKEIYDIWNQMNREGLTIYHSPDREDVRPDKNPILNSLKNEYISSSFGENPDYEQICKKLAYSFLSLISADFDRRSDKLQSCSDEIQKRKRRHKMKLKGLKAGNYELKPGM